MNHKPSSAIPPLAGLATYEEAQRVGPSVDQTVDLLRRYNFVIGSLYRISAAFINPCPESEVKGALSLHLYLDGEHSLALRNRVAELRRPPLYLDECPDSRLELLVQEILHSQITIEMLTAVYGVVRPALLDAIRDHLSELNPVIDFPTARILRQIAEEEQQMIGWGAAAIAGMTDPRDDNSEMLSWKTHIQAYLDAAGGTNGKGEPAGAAGLPAPRANAPFVPNVDPHRDSRSGDIYNFNYRVNDVYLDSEADWDERNLALMYRRYHEMDVPEMMASIILQTVDKSWDYYRDMGRQLWDEARHSMMGEIWFAKYDVEDMSRFPNHVGWSMHLNLDRTPLERHVILYYIEQSLMNGETGKRQEWLIAQNAKDPLATYFQDYDWADEVLHAQIGRKWLKPEVGTVKAILDRAAVIIDKPSASLIARTVAERQSDWWPNFVKVVLGKESTSAAGAENPLVPRYETIAASPSKK